MYIIDIHTHTSEVSPCGKWTAAESVAEYKSLGYDAICVTDHFNERYLERFGGDWAHRVESFMSGYEHALAAGREAGLDVYFGAELALNDSHNEYLAFGIDREFLLENRDMLAGTPRELGDRIRAHGGILIQAHPMRRGLTLAEPEALDGIEAFNGNPRHNSSNLAAMAEADRRGCILVSGSDGHQTGDAGMGGLALRAPVHSVQELIAALRSGDYAMLVTPRKLSK